MSEHVTGAAGLRVDEGGEGEDRAELASLLASWREAKRNGLRRLTFGLWKGDTPRNHEGGGAVSEAVRQAVKRVQRCVGDWDNLAGHEPRDRFAAYGEQLRHEAMSLVAALSSAEPVESAAEAGEPICGEVERLREALRATAPILYEFTAELGRANRNADFVRVRDVRERVVLALTASQNGDA